MKSEYEKENKKEKTIEALREKTRKTFINLGGKKYKREIEN